MSKLITFENFEKHLGEEVIVEICGKWGGLMYPERNILIGANKGEYFFKSIEEDGTHQYWSYGVTDDNWSCQVFNKAQNDAVSDTGNDDSSNTAKPPISEQEIEELAERKLLEMFEEQPRKLFMFFLSIIGREMNKTNATDLTLSQHMDIEGNRYKVECKSTLEALSYNSKQKEKE